MPWRCPIQDHGARFDAHTLLVGTLAILCGYQVIFFAIFAKILAIRAGLLPADRRIERFQTTFNLEVGLAIAAACADRRPVLVGSSSQSVAAG